MGLDLHKLDHRELELLLIKNRLEDLASSSGLSTTEVSDLITEKFKEKRISKPIEEVGGWMKSQERVSYRNLRPDTWLELKSTNLYKKLMTNGN
jgi:hypothetical protein